MKSYDIVKHQHDVIVIGAGGSGLRATMGLAQSKHSVACISKVFPTRSHTVAAQDDIKILRNKLSQKSFESGVLYMKMEEYKAALLAFKLVTDQYYDTDYIDQTHLKIIEIYVHRGEFEEARNHFESKRKNIENLNMADLVNAWFDQGRVFDRIEMK